MSEYSEYTYTFSKNPNGSEGDKLASLVLKKILSLGGIKKICELGCGNGYFSKLLAEQGFKVTGIDNSESGIEQARKNAPGGVDFIKADLQPQLADILPAAPYDLVVSIETLEHLYNPFFLASLAHRILKPEGYLIITTPYHGYLKNVLIASGGLHDKHYNPLWDCGHIKFFSVATLSSLLEKAGFAELKFGYWGRFRYLAKSMVCIAKKADKAK